MATYSALLGRVLIIIIITIIIMTSVTSLSLVLASVITVSHSLDLGYGGLPGQRTERGGEKKLENRNIFMDILMFRKCLAAFSGSKSGILGEKSRVLQKSSELWHRGAPGE